MVTKVIPCGHCASTNLIRYGRLRNGKQRYRCHDCGRTSCENPGSASYPDAFQAQVLAAYHERASMRGVCRIFGISRNTLAAWLKKATRLPALPTTLVPARTDDVLELDELWSFVRKRSQKRWVWLALCRRTRQIVAYVIGDRSAATCRRLWQRIPAAYRQGTVFTDFWEAYQQVIPATQHRPSGKETGQTSHIERWNNTLRQRVGRVVRKTLSFSKSDQMHAYCLRVFVHAYNRQRVRALTNAH